MSTIQSVLSWCQSDGGIATLKAVLMLLGFVMLVFAVSGFWYVFFKMTAARSRRTSIEFPPIKESLWTVTGWNIVVLDRMGNPTHKEGPFYNWDEVIARCAELNAKRS